MRTRVCFVVCIFLLAARVHAQDLRYRMITHLSMPAMPSMPDAPAMTMYAKGKSIRMDVEMPAGADHVMQASTIIDLEAQKVIVLQPSEKVYLEQPFQLPRILLDSAATGSDGGAYRPKVFPTTDTQVIDGQATKRYLVTTELAAPPAIPGLELQAGSRVIVVVEQWLSSDPRLAQPYEAFARVMQGGEGNPLSQLMAGMPKGFPIRSTMLMLQLPKDSAYDVESILKAGVTGPNVIMAVTTEAQDIRTDVLDAALFKVPAGYSRQ